MNGLMMRQSLLIGKVAKWWTPDDVVFVESIPLGATGRCRRTGYAKCSKIIGCRALRRLESRRHLAVQRAVEKQSWAS